MPPEPPPVSAGLQVIPRPPAHRPGGPPPWAGLEPSARRSISLDRVRAALAAAHADTDAADDDGLPAGPTRSIVEFIRSVEGVDVAGNPAAVLVPLFEEDGETRVLLTVRSGQLRSHRGEVAFPGGRLEAGETNQQGALREAYEEVGLDPGLVTVIGHLSSLPTVSSNTLMTPVVGTLPGRPATVASPAEVARIFDVALSELVEDGAFREEWWAVPGRPGADGTLGGEFPVWFFTAGGEIIWGATARVLTELLCLVLGVAVPGIRPVG
jgi:8-oxo-dGTP pyrophosphatase MutT (NUDIX family)